jgi:hypothetical protein
LAFNFNLRPYSKEKAKADKEKDKIYQAHRAEGSLHHKFGRDRHVLILTDLRVHPLEMAGGVVSLMLTT